MDNKQLLEKFIKDTVKIESKLIKVRETPSGNSYRNLANMYKDSLKISRRIIIKTAIVYILRNFT